MRFAVETFVDAPVSRVWEVLLDWEGSTEWMVDATTVEVIGSQREGVGTRVRAVTRVAGIPLTDVMVVSAWENERLIEVDHQRWPIKGPARFIIEPEGAGTRFIWEEDLTSPLGALGEFGGRVLRRPIEALLRKSLRKFRMVAERR